MSEVNVNPLADMTIAEARDGLTGGQFSPKELVEAHLASMAAGKALNAYVTETADLALEQAEASAGRIAAGSAGPLEGIPIAIKDLFCTKGVKTTAGSKILADFVPPYESTVTERLFGAGAVMLGKANLDEFAMGSANLTSAAGACLNPWRRSDAPDLELVPGGSSGGSAAAVAGRLALGAVGTDTGGSIRQPASFCGVVGMKPTYGRCSRWGVVAYASSLDQPGPLTRSVRDAAIMLEVMGGHDPKDSTSAPLEAPHFEQALTGDIRGLKVGIPKEYRPESGMDPDVDAAWDKAAAMLKDAGAEIVEISLPHTKYALAAYYIIAPAEASSNLARYDGVRYGHRVDAASLDDLYRLSRGAGFGEEVKRRILVGTYALSAGYYDAYYLKAQKVRALIAEDFRKAYDTVDVILAPIAPTTAFPVSETIDDPVTMYLNDVFTVPISLAGLPSLCVPVDLSSKGLPIGMQLIGRSFDEETVFRAGGVLESAAAFTHKPGGLS